MRVYSMLEKAYSGMYNSADVNDRKKISAVFLETLEKKLYSNFPHRFFQRQQNFFSAVHTCTIVGTYNMGYT